VIITLVFKKDAIFAKIAENIDPNIDPWSKCDVHPAIPLRLANLATHQFNLLFYFSLRQHSGTYNLCT
jgi:hypothetical protein